MDTEKDAKCAETSVRAEKEVAKDSGCPHSQV